MRGSSKPCPGCGKVKLGRPAKEVCLHCKRLLERGEWLESVVSKMGDDEITVALGKHAYCNEYIHSHSGVGPKLQDTFQRIARTSSRPAAGWLTEFELLGKILAGFRSYAIMSRPLAEAIRDLRVEVEEALNAEYECGKADGHDLLLRLASGEISTSAFDAVANKGRNK